MSDFVKASGWISTYSGKKFYFFKPNIRMINIKDIAHALSNICRFGGQCYQFYSVAQHSILTSYLIEQKYALEGLLHDSTEAYIGDMVRPLKKYIETFCEIEDNIYNVIAKKYSLNISDDCIKKTKVADNTALVAEAYYLMSKRPGLTEKLGKQFDKRKKIALLRCSPKNAWSPHIAEQAFLERFEELTNA